MNLHKQRVFTLKMFFKKKIELEEMSQIDRFSITSMVLLNKMSIKKGIKNNFDFTCSEYEDRDYKIKIKLSSSENSEFDISKESENFKIFFFFEAKAKN